MTGRNDRGVGWGGRIAGVVAAAVLLAFGVQGAIGAPSDKKPREERKGAARQADTTKSAEAGAKAQASATKPQGTVTRSVGGATVSIDPATGRLRPPTAEEAQALAAGLQHMLSRETDAVPVTQLPDGTLMVNLEDTFQEVAMATKDHRGKVRLHCVNDAARAMALLNGTATATPDTAATGASRAADKKAAVKTSRDAAEKE